MGEELTKNGKSKHGVIEEYILGTKEYSKSNFLIGAKYKSSLIEAKLTALSLSKIQCEGEKVFSEIKAADLKRIFKSNSNSFYGQLNDAAANMTGQTIGMSNPDTMEFKYIAVITSAEYRNGIFRVRFNEELKNSIVNIKSNFTKLPLAIMMSFKSVYGFRLYEVLKSKIYQGTNVTIELAELKFLLGVVNSEIEGVRKILNGQKRPDYEKALSVSPEKMFEDYPSFRRRVIEKAVSDINDKTELNVKFKPEKSGKGGKVYAITFTVDFKQQEHDEFTIDGMFELDEEQKQEIVDEIMDSIIEERLKSKDYRVIAETADYDIEKIRKVYDIMKKSSSNIENITGWLIKALKDGYDEPVRSITDRKKISNAFNNFKQNDYDFEQLELDLLLN